MIYLFLSPTKIITLFGCSWLINTKPLVRSVIYDLICPKSNDLYPTCFTLLPNSQLTINIPWSCYCTVDVFAVIHFVTVSSMWSLLMAANLCMLFLYCLLIQLCISVSDPVITREGLGFLKPLNPTKFGAYPWIFNFICRNPFLCFQWVKVRGECFVDIGGTVGHHCWNFLFMIYARLQKCNIILCCFIWFVDGLVWKYNVFEGVWCFGICVFSVFAFKWEIKLSRWER